MQRLVFELVLEFRQLCQRVGELAVDQGRPDLAGEGLEQTDVPHVELADVAEAVGDHEDAVYLIAAANVSDHAIPDGWEGAVLPDRLVVVALEQQCSAGRHPGQQVLDVAPGDRVHGCFHAQSGDGGAVRRLGGELWEQQYLAELGFEHLGRFVGGAHQSRLDVAGLVQGTHGAVEGFEP